MFYKLRNMLYALQDELFCMCRTIELTILGNSLESSREQAKKETYSFSIQRKMRIEDQAAEELKEIQKFDDQLTREELSSLVDLHRESLRKADSPKYKQQLISMIRKYEDMLK